MACAAPVSGSATTPPADVPPAPSLVDDAIRMTAEAHARNLSKIELSRTRTPEGSSVDHVTLSFWYPALVPGQPGNQARTEANPALVPGQPGNQARTEAQPGPLDGRAKRGYCAAAALAPRRQQGGARARPVSAKRPSPTSASRWKKKSPSDLRRNATRGGPPRVPAHGAAGGPPPRARWCGCCNAASDPPAGRRSC
jgi:hypothetical protein